MMGGHRGEGPVPGALWQKHPQAWLVNWAQRGRESSETNNTEGRLLLQRSLCFLCRKEFPRVGEPPKLGAWLKWQDFFWVGLNNTDKAETLRIDNVSEYYGGLGEFLFIMHVFVISLGKLSFRNTQKHDQWRCSINFPCKIPYYYKFERFFLSL